MKRADRAKARNTIPPMIVTMETKKKRGRRKGMLEDVQTLIHKCFPKLSSSASHPLLASGPLRAKTEAQLSCLGCIGHSVAMTTQTTLTDALTNGWLMTSGGSSKVTCLLNTISSLSPVTLQRFLIYCFIYKLWVITTLVHTPVTSLN